ncbi:MAG TPA: PDZ domain-containing protein [Planctomycetaceae bacterium]|nr:PDZ domain-containing protein [Planctomycetaceae bacterium]
MERVTLEGCGRTSGCWGDRQAAVPSWLCGRRTMRRSSFGMLVSFGLMAGCGWGSGALGAESLEWLEQEAFRRAVERIAPSVVRIETIGGMERVEGLLFGTGPTTGLVVGADGYIASAAFNFLNRPSSILVQLPDGTRRPAELVATDHSRMLVLLKIDPPEPLAVPEFTPPDEIQVGAWAIAVGRAFEIGQPNVAVGILSAVNRIWGKALQTDTAVSPNNYGGPLIDIHGRVLGLLVPLSPQADNEVAGVEWYDSGIGFAIPGFELQRIVERLKGGKDLHPGLAGFHFGRENIYIAPPVVVGVRPNSPAYKAGLEPGDRIVRVDDRSVARAAEVKEAVSRRYAGQTLSLVIERGEQRRECQIELAARLEPYEHPFLGILPVRSRPKPGQPQQSEAGVAVRYVWPDSPAAKAGMNAGDRIVGLGGGAVKDAASLRESVNQRSPGDQVEVRLRRGDRQLQVAVTLGRLPEEPPGGPLPPAWPAGGDRQQREAEPAAGGATDFQSLKIPEFENDAWLYAPPQAGPPVSYGLVVWLPQPGAVDRRQLLQQWRLHCRRDHLLLLVVQSASTDRWLPREAELVRRLLDQVTATHAVDPTRVVLGGCGAGGSLAFLTAVRNRDVVRAVVLVDSPMAGVAPENEPPYRLAFYVAKTKKTAVLDRVDAAVARLRRMKYPVCVRILGQAPRELNVEEMAELARWIDSLDRI